MLTFISISLKIFKHNMLFLYRYKNIILTLLSRFPSILFKFTPRDLYQGHRLEEHPCLPSWSAYIFQFARLNQQVCTYFYFSYWSTFIILIILSLINYTKLIQEINLLLYTTNIDYNYCCFLYICAFLFYPLGI